MTLRFNAEAAMARTKFYYVEFNSRLYRSVDPSPRYIRRRYNWFNDNYLGALECNQLWKVKDEMFMIKRERERERERDYVG